jgi:hypothetical protein
MNIQSKIGIKAASISGVRQAPTTNKNNEGSYNFIQGGNEKW